MTSWRDLVVSDADGNTGDTLGFFVDSAPANLDDATIQNGRIVEWPGFFLSIEGEESDWDTPRGDIDWAGFEDALTEARGE